jgi:hypothetical protein
MNKALKEILSWMSMLVAIAILAMGLPQLAAAQDPEDPPGRAARLGYMKGSVSFLPAGELDCNIGAPQRSRNFFQKT